MNCDKHCCMGNGWLILLVLSWLWTQFFYCSFIQLLCCILGLPTLYEWMKLSFSNPRQRCSPPKEIPYKDLTSFLEILLLLFHKTEPIFHMTHNSWGKGHKPYIFFRFMLYEHANYVYEEKKSIEFLGIAYTFKV